ncbi:MAG: hypothetical protein CME52_02350 [Halieaceae bacterium]|jgi:hypothetical protein|nr:hypothetical protein [Halieaceae bacterium]PDH37255.1 MAG: hypothetical protein CNE43_03565 [Halieaceae bacterium MED-G26]RPG91687.1 MAG: nuclear transport factor 2 family protein [Cellvibrionales bacterium TMED157]
MTVASDLASRVQALEDIEAIKRLKARWWFACDTRDLAGMRACYDEDDFLIDFGFIGEFTDMDAFMEVFESLACHPTHVDMHHGTAPEIEMTGPDNATGRWRMRFQLLETENRQVQLMSGYYEDVYARVNGEWKMRVSKYTLMSNLFLSSSDGVLAIEQIGSAPGLVTEQT